MSLDRIFTAFLRGMVKVVRYFTTPDAGKVDIHKMEKK